MNSITNIKSYFSAHNGIQRSNRYQVYFENAPVSYITDQTEIQALSATVGVRAMDCVADNLTGYGRGRSVPRAQKFGAGVFLTFPVTNDNHIIRMFDQWFNVMYSGYRQGSNFTTNYYDDTVKNTNMIIQLLDPNGAVNLSMRFFEVFPLETQPIDLSMLENNKFLTYSVLMQYRDFIYETGGDFANA
jgi:hypothetical protein